MSPFYKPSEQSVHLMTFETILLLYLVSIKITEKVPKKILLDADEICFEINKTYPCLLREYRHKLKITIEKYLPLESIVNLPRPDPSRIEYVTPSPSGS